MVSFTQPNSGRDPRGVKGGMALTPALALVKTQFLMHGYTVDAFSISSSSAVEASSVETLEEKFLDPQSHVEPITTLRGPWTASHASDKIEGQ